ncbi:MAG: hypothetical protein Q9160_001091 [Pyrenula sp. 1 TL-2023]
MSLLKIAPDKYPHLNGLAGRMDAQNGSPFFGLPLELRLEVYRYLLAGNAFHIEITRCEADFYAETYLGNVDKADYMFDSLFCDGSFLHGTRLLSLTKSCRKAYLETIRIFYEENTFHFDKFQDVAAFYRWFQDLQAKTKGGDNSVKISHLRVSQAWSQSLPHDLPVLLDGLRTLELGWKDFWLMNLGKHFRAPTICDLVQLKGVELRIYNNSRAIEKTPGLGTLGAALQEIIRKAKTDSAVNLLSEIQNATAVLAAPDLMKQSLRQLVTKARQSYLA